jgi:hypothetical protein
MVHKEPHQAVFIKETLRERCRMLIPDLQSHKQYGAAGRISMTSVANLALALGLTQLEEELSKSTKEPR